MHQPDLHPPSPSQFTPGPAIGGSVHFQYPAKTVSVRRRVKQHRCAPSVHGASRCPRGRRWTVQRELPVGSRILLLPLLPSRAFSTSSFARDIQRRRRRRRESAARFPSCKRYLHDPSQWYLLPPTWEGAQQLPIVDNSTQTTCARDSSPLIEHVDALNHLLDIRNTSACHEQPLEVAASAIRPIGAASTEANIHPGRPASVRHPRERPRQGRHETRACLQVFTEEVRLGGFGRRPA